MLVLVCFFICLSEKFDFSHHELWLVENKPSIHQLRCENVLAAALMPELPLALLLIFLHHSKNCCPHYSLRHKNMKTGSMMKTKQKNTHSSVRQRLLLLEVLKMKDYKRSCYKLQGLHDRSCDAVPSPCATQTPRAEPSMPLSQTDGDSWIPTLTKRDSNLPDLLWVSTTSASVGE